MQSSLRYAMLSDVHNVSLRIFDIEADVDQARRYDPRLDSSEC